MGKYITSALALLACGWVLYSLSWAAFDIYQSKFNRPAYLASEITETQKVIANFQKQFYASTDTTEQRDLAARITEESKRLKRYQHELAWLPAPK